VPACSRAAAELASAVERAFADGTLVPIENGGTAGTEAITRRVSQCLEKEDVRIAKPN
jgi:hypothetical protein